MGEPLPPPKGQKRTICLVMIVKDEEDVIERCLDSVLPFISYWIICDTGSTDATTERIQAQMKSREIPGKLYQRPWVDFGHNRSESLNLAHGTCDYRFVMDADDELVCHYDDCNPFATVRDTDAYDMQLRWENDSALWRPLLIRSDQNWQFRGVIHEHVYLVDGSATTAPIFMAHVRPGVSAFRKYPDCRVKFLGDAGLLAKALRDDPGNSRYVFYLAQSYRHAGELELAMKWYAKRLEYGGGDEEIYFSLYMIGQLRDRLGYDESAVIDALCAAYEVRPTRIEPMHYLLRYLRIRKRHILAGILGDRCKWAAEKPPPDALFVEHRVWHWHFLDEYSIALAGSGRFEEALECVNRILRSQWVAKIPAIELERIQKSQRDYANQIPALVSQASPGTDADAGMTELVSQALPHPVAAAAGKLVGDAAAEAVEPQRLTSRPGDQGDRRAQQKRRHSRK